MIPNYGEIHEDQKVDGRLILILSNIAVFQYVVSILE
jgi:hypothetical protein